MFWGFVIGVVGLAWGINWLTGLDWLYCLLGAVGLILAGFLYLIFRPLPEGWQDLQQKTNNYRLDGSQLTLSYTQNNSPTDGEITLELFAATVKNKNGRRTLHSISGQNLKTGGQRTIRGERITSAWNPETGEIVDNLLVHVLTHREGKGDHSATF